MHLPGMLSKLFCRIEHAPLVCSSIFCLIKHFNFYFSLYTIGYGQTGPDAQRAGYDVIVAATAGLVHITGPKVRIALDRRSMACWLVPRIMGQRILKGFQIIDLLYYILNISNIDAAMSTKILQHINLYMTRSYKKQQVFL